MVGGERVGTAYVKLIADGDSVPDDVRDAMEKLEPTLRKAGEDHAAAYDKGFDKQYEKDNEKFRTKIDRLFAKALGKMNATGKIIGEEVGDNLFEAIQSRLEEAFDPDLARRIRTNLQAAFAVDQDLDRLKSKISDVNRLAIQATKELAHEAEIADRLRIKAENDLQKEIRGTIAETDRLVQSIERENTARDRGITSTLAGMAKLVQEGAKADGVFEKFDRQMQGIFKKGEEGWVDQAEGVDHLTGRFGRLNARISETEKRIGRFAGKGSRNDFINLFGAIVQGATMVGTALFKIPGYLEGAFGEGGGGGTGGFTKLLSGAASSIIAVAVAFGAVVIVLSPLAALLSGVTAAVIALAGSLVFAAAAAGAVALVLGGVLVASIGAVVAALMTMEDQQRKVLSQSFQPLIDGAKEFGQAVADGMIPGLQRAAELLEPLTEGAADFGEEVGKAFGDVARYFARATQSPGFLAFRDAFEKFLPQAIRDLGAIATNTLGGIGGIFTAAIPLARQFLNWLRGNTKEFSDWANSAKGQNQIADFLERAADSARAVGHWAGRAIALVSRLLSEGKGSGDTLFDDMADSFQRLITYIDENPDSVDSFFRNGVVVARELGNLIVTIGKAIDDLDTEEAREALKEIFSLVEDVIDIIGNLAPVFAAIVGGIILVDKVFSSTVGYMIAGWGKVVDAAHTVARAFRSIGGFLGGVRDKMNNLGDEIGPWASRTSSKIIGFFRRIPGRIGGFFADTAARAASGFARMVDAASNAFSRVLSWGQSKLNALKSKAGDVIDSVVGFFRSLPGKVAGALTSVSTQAKQKFEEIVEKVRGIPDRIAGLFSGLAGKILSAIGTIDIGSLIKVPSPGGGIPFVPGLAVGGVGGITGGPMLRWVGEDGPEAIVPLNRPLSQVDPSVRALSAAAQGYSPSGPSKTVDVGGVTIVTPTEDPAAVAEETINKIAAMAM